MPTNLSRSLAVVFLLVAAACGRADAPSPAPNGASDAGTIEDLRPLEQALREASVEVNKLRIPDVIYRLDENTARGFFERYFAENRMTGALALNLAYPVFSWGSNQSNLQKAIAPVLVGEVERFFHRFSGPAAVDAAFAADTPLHDHVFHTLKFLAFLADSKHLDGPAREETYRRLLTALDASRLCGGSNRTIDASGLPFVNPVKVQLVMTCFSFADSAAGRAHLAKPLGLSGDRRALLDDFGILVLDNEGLDAEQLSAIRSFMDAVPPRLRRPAVVTCFDLLVNPRKNRRVSVHDFRCVASFNLFSAKVGASFDNQFPPGGPVAGADLFAIVLAHEYNHLVDARYLASTPPLADFKTRVLEAAGRDHRNYLRSMFDDGFFETTPQEFVASMANMYFADSRKTLDLALRRAAEGNYNPLNQFVLMASLYGDSDGVRFFRVREDGRTLVVKHPASTEGGLVTSLTVNETEHRFSFSNGLVVRVQSKQGTLREF